MKGLFTDSKLILCSVNNAVRFGLTALQNGRLIRINGLSPVSRLSKHSLCNEMGNVWLMQTNVASNRSCFLNSFAKQVVHVLAYLRTNTQTLNL